jgi:hypothetical protein
MKSTKYDPPTPGGKAPQHPGYPPHPQQPYYQYPGYPPQYPYPYYPPGPKKDDKKLVTIIVVIVFIFIIIPLIIVIAGVLYVWSTPLDEPRFFQPYQPNFARLDQGPGNMTSGCLFTLQKEDGAPVKIENYRFQVGRKGSIMHSLKWPDNGNTTAYSIDSNIKANDGDWWDFTEIVGFDAPSGLTGIEDGNFVEVKIVDFGYDEIVFSSSFVYRD